MTQVMLPFEDRRQAGRVLAEKLAHYRGDAKLLVLALPRGGVAVGFEVARALHAPLDIFVVRKLGFPGHEEYAMGAIASGGIRVMTPQPGLTVSPDEVAKVVAREQAELLRREQLYRNQRPAVSLAGRTVIVVDDGLATGATMRAAVLAIRQQRSLGHDGTDECGEQNREIADRQRQGRSRDSCQDLRDQAGGADEVVCAAMPEPFRAVGLWYEKFPQASDDEVRALLEEARSEHSLQAPSKAVAQQAAPVSQAQNALLAGLRRHLQPLTGEANDYDALLQLIGPARFAKPIGPTRGASTATCADCPQTPMRLRRCRVSSVSPPGCGAIPRCAILSSGCANTTQGSARSGRSTFMALTCTACSPQSMRC